MLYYEIQLTQSMWLTNNLSYWLHTTSPNKLINIKVIYYLQIPLKYKEAYDHNKIENYQEYVCGVFL